VRTALAEGRQGDRRPAEFRTVGNGGERGGRTPEGSAPGGRIRPAAGCGGPL